jgi:predicted ATP-grasp superfamily ATP-dependent carboligase
MRDVARLFLVVALGVASLLVPDAARARVQRPRRVLDSRQEPAQPTRQHSAARAPGRSSARAEESRVSEPAPLPPALLTTPEFHGTLAAVRSLGREAIPVTTAGPSRFGMSAWSKYATRSVLSPPVRDTARFLRWLQEFGRQHEKHVLLPTCDDTAWLYSRHRSELSELFYMNSPDIGVVHSLLHKGLLARMAADVGLVTPRTWFPDSEESLARIAFEARFPVVIKPVTQVLFESRIKGYRVFRKEDLAAAYRAFAALRHDPVLAAYDPSAVRPMVQEYYPAASVKGVYSISGYARGGRVCGARGQRKVLTRPRPMGVGICFEEAAVDTGLVAGLERLVQRAGFSGVLEAEFIDVEREPVLIDFNPRFYNQMGFDLARGVPLASLAYFDTLPNDVLAERVCQSVRHYEPGGRVFAYSSALKLMIRSQRLAGVLSEAEARTWLSWYERNRDRCVDAVKDAEDVWPERIDHLNTVRQYARHPFSTFRALVLNR